MLVLYPCTALYCTLTALYLVLCYAWTQQRYNSSYTSNLRLYDRHEQSFCLGVTVPYCNVLHYCCTVLYCTERLNCTVVYCAILCYTVLRCTVLYWTVVLYCVVLWYTVLYCTALYCTVLYCTVLYCNILYGTVRYGTVLYCTHCRRCDLSKSDGYVCRLGATSRTIGLATECLDLCCVCVLDCMAFPLPFFPFSFSPLSLRGRGATDNSRTTLISHSTVCQSTLTHARARTF